MDCGLDTVDAMREVCHPERKAKGQRHSWFGEDIYYLGKEKDLAEKDQQKRGEELIMNTHICRREFQELGINRVECYSTKGEHW